MSNILFIAAGGAIGAVMRYLASTGLHSVMGRAFPYGTLAVNVSGSFAMGLAFVLLLEKMDVGVEWRMGLTIGLLGAFTTFSTFSIETLNLIESGEPLKAGLNVFLSVTLCLAFAWLGMILARQL